MRSVYWYGKIYFFIMTLVLSVYNIEQNFGEINYYVSKIFTHSLENNKIVFI